LTEAHAYNAAGEEVKTVVHHGISFSREMISDFCRRNRIRRLALFGSVLRQDFTDSSDVDVLVEFEPGARVGLIRLAGIEEELSKLLGRKVDLNTPGFLSPYFREKVLAEAEVQYDAA
jgi:predicted nucleotidyltransferase